MTTRGSNCCKTPITQAERARIPELDFVSLLIGENDPPKEWQEAFKFIPETDEERLDRLLNIPSSTLSSQIVNEPVLPTRKKRNTEIVAQNSERLKRSGQIVAQKNKEIHKEDEVAQYFLKVENFNTTFEYRMAQVTELICHAKETETRYFSIRACDKAGNCGLPSPLAPVRVTLYYNSSLKNLPAIPTSKPQTKNEDKAAQTGGSTAVIGASLGAIGIIL
ncbi:unnamed protein product [Oikopleura dioica]|uniref:Uncharacterized protein n=1 Tax=Oikopleura dioica TaxID=34765 RepID=E4XMB3_OIKDI|nr:unnamed protein product [Oikopleura dioica]